MSTLHAARRWGLVALAGVGCGLPELPRVAEPCGKWPEPGTYKFTVEVEGRTRKAEVYVPPTEGPRDLVVALHGSTSSASDFRSVTQFDHIAGRENFVLVLPQGRKTLFWRMWNAGSCCGNIDEAQRDANDVQFLDKLVAEISPQVCGDRVLAVGFSNGGMMVNRWGCEGSEPDAVVSAAGPYLRDQCQGKALPFRHYHGLLDTVIPYAGGQGERGGMSFPPAQDTYATWAERNGCPDDVEAESFEFGPMTCERRQCEETTELCTISGWRHAWPGGRNTGRLGGSSDATSDVLDFLHDNVEPSAGGTEPTGATDR